MSLDAYTAVMGLDGLDGPDGSDGYIERGEGDLLDAVRAWFARYVVTLHDRDLDLLTLWAAHTHFVDRLYTTPRLQITSPLPGSGKTTCLEHLQRLGLNPVQFAALTSPSVLTRMLDSEPRTLLLDEVDKNLNPDRPGVGDLLAIINTGYKRGGSRPVNVPNGTGGWDVVEMPTFAAIAFAGISPRLPDDTMDRVVSITLLPDAAGEAEDSDWEEIEEEALALGAKIADWAGATVTFPKPDLPAGVRGRAKERWRPLWRVAHTAGGDWPARCQALIEHETEMLAQDREEGLMREHPAVKMLRQIAEAWPPGLETWPTEAIRMRLIANHPKDWGPNGDYSDGLTKQRIGRYMGQAFKVRTVRGSSGERLGYSRADVARVCIRVGVTPPLHYVTDETVETVGIVKPGAA